MNNKLPNDLSAIVPNYRRNIIKIFSVLSLLMREIFYEKIHFFIFKVEKLIPPSIEFI